MILFNKAFFKVWKAEDKGKYTLCSVSTGDKQQDGTYKNSNWNLKLIGDKGERDVLEGDTIVAIKGKVENVWDKKNEKNWLNVIVFQWEVQRSETSAAVKEAKDDGFYPVDDEDEDLPF